MNDKKATNVTWHDGNITPADRERLNGHKGVCLWYTGLSASGKSSIAVRVEEKLFEHGIRTFILDGDNIRHGLNKNLGELVKYPNCLSMQELLFVLHLYHLTGLTEITQEIL